MEKDQPEIKKIHKELNDEFRQTGIEDSLVIEGVIIDKTLPPLPTQPDSQPEEESEEIQNNG